MVFAQSGLRGQAVETYRTDTIYTYLDPDEFPDPQALSGYVHEDVVIEMAETAGFELVAKSEINANPKDGRSHPKGVWTLPPALRLKDRDRAKYLAIGESDRMTLKFVKPAG